LAPRSPKQLRTPQPSQAQLLKATPQSPRRGAAAPKTLPGATATPGRAKRTPTKPTKAAGGSGGRKGVKRRDTVVRATPPVVRRPAYVLAAHMWQVVYLACAVARVNRWVAARRALVDLPRLRAHSAFRIQCAARRWLSRRGQLRSNVLRKYVRRIKQRLEAAAALRAASATRIQSVVRGRRERRLALVIQVAHWTELFRRALRRKVETLRARRHAGVLRVRRTERELLLSGYLTRHYATCREEKVAFADGVLEHPLAPRLLAEYYRNQRPSAIVNPPSPVFAFGDGDLVPEMSLAGPEFNGSPSSPDLEPNGFCSGNFRGVMPKLSVAALTLARRRSTVLATMFDMNNDFTATLLEPAYDPGGVSPVMHTYLQEKVSTPKVEPPMVDGVPMVDVDTNSDASSSSSTAADVDSQGDLVGPPRLIDEIEVAYGHLIEVAEVIDRKEIERQASTVLARTYEKIEWSVYVVSKARVVPLVFRPLVLQFFPRWRAKRAIRLILDEIRARQKIIDLYDHVPVRPPWQPDRLRIRPEAPSITKPMATRVARRHAEDEAAAGSTSATFGGGSRQFSAFRYDDDGGGGDDDALMAHTFGETEIDLDDDINDTRKHRRFSTAVALQVRLGGNDDDDDGVAAAPADHNLQTPSTPRIVALSKHALDRRNSLGRRGSLGSLGNSGSVASVGQFARQYSRNISSAYAQSRSGAGFDQDVVYRRVRTNVPKYKGEHLTQVRSALKKSTLRRSSLTSMTGSGNASPTAGNSMTAVGFANARADAASPDAASPDPSLVSSPNKPRNRKVVVFT
jgi:hypothetical protein